MNNICFVKMRQKIAMRNYTVSRLYLQYWSSIFKEGLEMAKTLNLLKNL